MMKLRRHSGICAVMVLLLMLSLSVGVAASAKQVELYVAAAASLKDAMMALQTDYHKKHPEVQLFLNLASSGALQTQIEQGSPADLFVSAAQKQMDVLEKKALIKKETRRDLLENHLVLVVPKSSKLAVQSFPDLTADAVKKVGIGAPESVPAGQYAWEVFENLQIAAKLRGKLVLGTNVRAVLSYVETGNVDAGVVYRTDAAISGQVKIVAVAPKGSHKPIIYPAAVLANARQPQAALKFLKYLTSGPAEKIFNKYGFLKVR
jgi:molybdate transport system substrate-binding protein